MLLSGKNQNSIKSRLKPSKFDFGLSFSNNKPP